MDYQWIKPYVFTNTSSLTKRNTFSTTMYYDSDYIYGISDSEKAHLFNQ